MFAFPATLSDTRCCEVGNASFSRNIRRLITWTPFTFSSPEFRPGPGSGFSLRCRQEPIVPEGRGPAVKAACVLRWRAG